MGNYLNSETTGSSGESGTLETTGSSRESGTPETIGESDTPKEEKKSFFGSLKNRLASMNKDVWDMTGEELIDQLNKNTVNSQFPNQAIYMALLVADLKSKNEVTDKYTNENLDIINASNSKLKMFLTDINDDKSEIIKQVITPIFGETNIDTKIDNFKKYVKDKISKTGGSRKTRRLKTSKKPKKDKKKRTHKKK